eukprot:3266742-Prymnesium_polylepis.1
MDTDCSSTAMDDHAADSRKRPIEDAGPVASAAATAGDNGDAPPADVGLDDDTMKQIRVDGLNKWVSKKQVQTRLESACGVIGIRRLKKFDKQDFAFVYFES